MNPLRLFWGWKPRKIECFRATNQSVKQLPILEKRKIQAEVLGPVFREMVEQVGSEKAASILKEAIRKAAIEEGKHFREKADASLSTMDQFVELMELWKAGGALEMEFFSKAIRALILMSTAAVMQKCIGRWVCRKSGICSHATGTAVFARALTRS